MSLFLKRVVRTSESAKQQVSKRCKDLAAFMESLMDEITKPPNLKIDVPTEEQSFSERDSVMFGEISPHHDYYDSKSSSATPPSYNQLNYNENILRFFDSKPKTMVYADFPSSGSNKNLPNGERLLNAVDNITPTNSNGSGSSGQSSESIGNSGETLTDTSKDKLQPPTLTKQLLCRHNEDMEKQMVQKHRDMRNKNDRDNKAKERLKPFDNKEEQNWVQTNHGLKRSGSFTWDTEPHKTLKTTLNTGMTPVATSTDTVIPQQLPTSSTGPVEPNLWPPFSVSLTPAQSSRQEYSGTQFANTMPMYYITNQRPENNLSYQNGYMTQQLQYMPSMMYHPFMFGTSPMVYSPMVYPPGPIYTQAGETPQQTWPTNQTHVTESESIPSSSTQQTMTTSAYKEELLSKQTDSEDLNSSSVPFEDSSYHSSFYSYLKTDKSESSSENEKIEEQHKVPAVKKVAPWMEGLSMTPEFVLNYQLPTKSLEEVLKADKVVLEKLIQPVTVSQQLYQMYSEMEPEGIYNLSLEKDPISSNDSSDDTEDDLTKFAPTKCKKIRALDYNATMAMLFEEDAPMPSPNM